MFDGCDTSFARFKLRSCVPGFTFFYFIVFISSRIAYRSGVVFRSFYSKFYSLIYLIMNFCSFLVISLRNFISVLYYAIFEGGMLWMS
jgi:hypothetical protein